MAWCMTPGCNAAVEYEQGIKQFTCEGCDKSFCIQCKTVIHTGLTCEQNMQNQNLSQQDKKFLQYAKNQKFRQCPSCRMMVQRKSGCGHMKCNCKYEFCYFCGKKHQTCNCSSQVADYYGIRNNIYLNEFDYFQQFEQLFLTTSDLNHQRQRLIFNRQNLQRQRRQNLRIQNQNQIRNQASQSSDRLNIFQRNFFTNRHNNSRLRPSQQFRHEPRRQQPVSFMNYPPNIYYPPYYMLPYNVPYYSMVQIPRQRSNNIVIFSQNQQSLQIINILNNNNNKIKQQRQRSRQKDQKKEISKNKKVKIIRNQFKYKNIK